ncbi:MAG: bifunctional oligoribonuclease/PAP phosphatase NrnA [Planctomycetota bacterium]
MKISLPQLNVGVKKNYRPVIRQILHLIKQHKKFLITTHVRCDGDAVGSELAIKSMLNRMGKIAHIVNVGGISKELMFLPGIQEVANGVKHLLSSYDAIIVVDSGSFERLGEMRLALPPHRPIINIDHHLSNDNFGAINWVAPEMSSVGEMVYRLIKTARIPIDKNTATNLYVSLITDTGHFRFASTTPYSHLMASDLLSRGVNLVEVTKSIYNNKTPDEIKLQYDCIKRMKFAENNRIAWIFLTRAMYKKHRTIPRDSQEYLQVLKSIKTVVVAILFRETAEDPLRIKISIRSEPPVDANKLAGHFGGGGHYRASGCTMTGSLKKAERLLISKARQYVKPL